MKKEMRQDYFTKLSEMTEDELYQECKHMIWLSAYAANNPRSDYHWQCDACYDQCRVRNRVDDIYRRAHLVVSESAR